MPNEQTQSTNTCIERSISFRRDTDRIRVTLPVRVIIASNHYIEGHSFNISKHGMSLTLEQDIEVQPNIIIEFHLPVIKQDLSIGAFIVWKHTLTGTLDEKQYTYGIRFQENGDDTLALIEQFIDAIYISDDIIYDRRGGHASKKTVQEYTVLNSISINAKPDDVFDVVRDIGEYKHFMRDVEEVEVISANENTATVRWEITAEGTVFTWTEQREVDETRRTINVTMSQGPFERYEGIYVVTHDANDRSIIMLHTNIALDVSHFDNAVIQRNRQAIKKTIRLFLTALKRQIERTEQGLSNAIIASRLIEYKNRDNRKVVGFHDYMKGTRKDSPFIIVMPGYGETKRDVLTIAYYLAANGFNVIRYDATDHVGESDGSIYYTTMKKLENDLVSTIDFLEQQYGVHTCGVVASSLSARSAMKAAAYDKRIVFFGSMVGVVNLQFTLHAVYNENILVDVANGRIKDTYEVLGFEVRNDFFVEADPHRYRSLEQTIHDMEQFTMPVVFVAAENDMWVRKEDTVKAFEAIPSQHKQLFILTEALHQLFENPERAKQAIQYIVAAALQNLRAENISYEQVADPDMKQLAVQNRKEKERLGRIYSTTYEKEKMFWDQYMIDFLYISKLPDYRDYLSVMDVLLGDYKKNNLLLDAGCGVGHYGAWLFGNIVKKIKTEPKANVKKVLPINYVGIDFVENSLRQAEQHHAELQNIFYDEFSHYGDVIHYSYTVSDLNKFLPFKDNHFHKICCSLVVSYVKDPLFTVKELMRVLKPGGKIVVSSLKPYPDISRIYCNFLGTTDNPDDVEEIRNLLSSAGQIKRKEGEGHYRFFSEHALTVLLMNAGGMDIKIIRSFGNQANVGVATKPSR